MRYETCHPGKIIPYHAWDPVRLAPHPAHRLIRPGQTGPVRKKMPAIPVLDIPPDLSLPNGTRLSDIGDYIIYNGHHRRMAALCAGVKEVSIAILETDEDLLLNGGIEKLTTAPHLTSISDHKKWVYDAVIMRTESAIEAEAWVHAQIRLYQ